MRRLTFATLVGTLSLSSYGCRLDLVSSSSSSPAVPLRSLPPAVPITEPLYLWESDWIARVPEPHWEARYDLSGLREVRDGAYTDIVVEYNSYCEPNVSIYNVRTGNWDDLVRSPEQFCLAVAIVTPATVSVEWLGLDARNYVDSGYQLRVRGGYRVRISRSNPAVRAATVLLKTEGLPYSAAYDGSSLWLATWVPSGPGKLYRVSLDGEVVEEVNTPQGVVSGLAHDGSVLWLDIWEAGTGEHVVYTLTDEGIIPRFVHSRSVNGIMTWGNGALWTSLTQADTTGTRTRLFAVHVASSIAAGRSVYMDSVEAPEVRVRGISWDGFGLLVLADSTLHRMRTTGEIVAAYPLSFRPTAVAWDGEALLMARDNGAIIRFSLP